MSTEKKYSEMLNLSFDLVSNILDNAKDVYEISKKIDSLKVRTTDPALQSEYENISNELVGLVRKALRESDRFTERRKEIHNG